MKSQDKDNILTKLNFEDRHYLNNMCEKVLSAPQEDFISHLSSFNSCLVSNKLLYRVNQYEHNGSPNAQEYYHCEENEININTDINLLIHNIHKLLCSEQEIILSGSNNSGKSDTVELDIITSIIFGRYISSDFSSYEKLKLLIDSNQPNNTGNFTYELFQKNFKIFIKFFILSDRFSQIFSQLENKDRIMTSELAIALNKLVKGLSDQNIFYTVSKKFSELIDGNQVHLTKTDFYTLFIKSLII